MLHRKEIVLAILLSIGIIILLNEYTAYIIYEETAYTWDFSTPSNYTYDSNTINLTGSQTKLVPTVIVTAWNTIERSDYTITSATYDSNDKLSKVQSLDEETQAVKKNKIFDVEFSQNLNNGYKINIYLKKEKAADIYICPESDDCSSPYGSVSYDGEDGWVAIGLSGLSEPASIFNIKTTDEKIKIDYINATYDQTIVNEATNTTYPVSGTITIPEISFTPSDHGIFSSNGQGNIIYEYSIDSGNIWNLVPQNNNISLGNAIKIQFRATLYSGDTNPVLNSIGFSRYSPTESETAGEEITITITRNNVFSEFKIKTASSLEDATTNITEYSNHQYATINQKTAFNKYVDIDAEEDLKNNISWVIINISYTDEEISASGLDESTLKIHYYNEITSQWEELSSTVDTENNYIWTNITHLSTFGIFGDPPQQPGNTNGGSSSGGGETIFTLPVDKTEQPEETEEEEKEITKTSKTSEGGKGEAAVKDKSGKGSDTDEASPEISDTEEKETQVTGLVSPDSSLGLSVLSPGIVAFSQQNWALLFIVNLLVIIYIVLRIQSIRKSQT